MDRSTHSETGRAIGILDTLVEIGPCHVVKLAALLDAHPIPIDRACDRLQQDGRLQRQPSGIYAITDSGHSLLAAATRESRPDALPGGETSHQIRPQYVTQQSSSNRKN